MSPALPVQPLTSLGLANNTNAKWWRDKGLRKLVFWQCCILVSQMTAGFDETVVGSFQAMEPWVQGLHSNFLASSVDIDFRS